MIGKCGFADFASSQGTYSESALNLSALSVARVDTMQEIVKKGWRESGWMDKRKVKEETIL